MSPKKVNGISVSYPYFQPSTSLDLCQGRSIHLKVFEPAKATGSMDSPLSVCMCVCMYVRNELISETAPTIFLKLGMKLGDNKGKKIARPDF